ncbi:MAG: hypothetical protein VX475_18040 [Myxococcota bacterium]|nr:hypothetical protein [Myxococcota bacterium]
MAGSADPDNRRMMFWNWNAGQAELASRVRALGKARKELEPLRRGARTELWVDDTLYVYARHTGPGEVVIVAMNKGGARTEEVTIPADLGLNGKTLSSVNSERQFVINGTSASIQLNSWEYAVYKVD